MIAVTPKQLRECRVIVVNDVTGRHTNTISPQSVEDCERCHGDVVTARDWISFHNVFTEDEGDSEPIGVAVRADKRDGRVIVVHWYPTTDDTEAARVAMAGVVDGTWRASL